VTHSGDTIRGLTKSASPWSLSEKLTVTDPVTKQNKTYTPQSLAQFTIGNDMIYVSDSVVLRSGAGQIYYEQLFLRRLVDGPIELYKLNYDIRKIEPAFDFQNEFYFFKPADQKILIDLPPSNYRDKINDALKSRNCNVEGNYRYNDQDMAELIQAYNTCLGGESVSYVNPLKKSRIKLGVHVGYNTGQIENTVTRVADFDLSDASGFHVGLDVELAVSSKFSLRSGLHYYNRSVQADSVVIVPEFFVNSGESFTTEAEITINQMTIPLQTRYYFSEEGISPFILGGGFIGFALSNSFTSDRQVFIPDSGLTRLEFVNDDVLDTTPNSLEFGYQIGAGVQLRAEDAINPYLEVTWNSSSSTAVAEANRIKQTYLALRVGVLF